MPIKERIQSDLRTRCAQGLRAAARSAAADVCLPVEADRLITLTDDDVIDILLGQEAARSDRGNDRGGAL